MVVLPERRKEKQESAHDTAPRRQNDDDCDNCLAAKLEKQALASGVEEDLGDRTGRGRRRHPPIFRAWVWRAPQQAQLYYVVVSQFSLAALPIIGLDPTVASAVPGLMG